MNKYRLLPEELTCQIHKEKFNFETTKDLEPISELLEQKRAHKSMNFGLNMTKRGFNIYVAGLWGTGRNTFTMNCLKNKVKDSISPKDWIYVNNFDNQRFPIAISLKNGNGKKFKRLIFKFHEILKKELSSFFVGTRYESIITDIQTKYNDERLEKVDQLNKIGKKYGFKFFVDKRGITSVPIKDDKPLTEEILKSLSDEEYEQINKNSEKLAGETLGIINELKKQDEEYQESLNDLDISLANEIIDGLLNRINEKFADNKEIKKYLIEVKEDIISHLFVYKYELKSKKRNIDLKEFFKRYDVNLFVDNSKNKTAPIISEVNPNFRNIVGAIEYENISGNWITNVSNIKPGALHLANGGYLVVQAKDILSEPFSWKALKRILLNKEITIEDIGNIGNTNVTQTLKPMPIPVDIKIIIIGDFYLYSILYNNDEEFKKLFKVLVDFNDEVDNNYNSIMELARFVAKFSHEGEIKHFSKEAVFEIVKYSCRMASNKVKLSAHKNSILDIIYEADSYAEDDDIVRDFHVITTINEQKNRINKIEKYLYEHFRDGTFLINVEGSRIGEINGLAVVGSSIQSFGKPSRISVSTYRGKDGLINIEREINQSGPSYDKGIMILNGYLGYKYAQNKPLSLSASIVFEQSYSGVDGDSASSTELYAIISSLAEVGINQGIAVTGSVNQRGEIQPVGGVNEKIEGFYQVCKLKGFTGSQGVIIPIQNVKNLVLKEEVIEAVRNKNFHIYAIENIDQGIELLMNKKAGSKLSDNTFKEDTIHYLVDKKLAEFAKYNKE